MQCLHSNFWSEFYLAPSSPYYLAWIQKASLNWGTVRLVISWAVLDSSWSIDPRCPQPRSQEIPQWQELILTRSPQMIRRIVSDIYYQSILAVLPACSLRALLMRGRHSVHLVHSDLTRSTFDWNYLNSLAFSQCWMPCLILWNSSNF